jgi:hypothetical protein
MALGGHERAREIRIAREQDDADDARGKAAIDSRTVTIVLR